MPHEIQIKRQRARRKVFKNREHIRPARRCQKIIRVIDAGDDSLQINDLSKRIALQPGGELSSAQRSKNRQRLIAVYFYSKYKDNISSVSCSGFLSNESTYPLHGRGVDVRAGHAAGAATRAY